MSVDSDLVTRLTGHAGLAALIGTRVYPNRLPDSPTVPAVVYQKITDVADVGQASIAGKRHRYQITGWAATHLEAGDVETQVHAALELQTFGQVILAEPAGSRDTYERDAHLHGRIVDYLLYQTDLT